MEESKTQAKPVTQAKAKNTKQAPRKPRTHIPVDGYKI